LQLFHQDSKFILTEENNTVPVFATKEKTERIIKSFLFFEFYFNGNEGG